MKCVYKITNKITGDFYIGSTIRFEKRRCQWRDFSSNTDSAVKKAILKYGRENFDFEPIEIFSEDTPKKEISKKELEYIHKLKPTYNTLGKPRPPSTRKKLSEAIKGRKNPESGPKISAALRERHKTIPQTNAGHLKDVLIVETQEVIHGVKAVAEKLGVHPATVTRAFKRTGTVKGYHVKLLKCRD